MLAKNLAKINRNTLLNLFVGMVLLLVLVLTTRSIISAFSTVNRAEGLDEGAQIKLDTEVIESAYNQLNSLEFSPLDLGN